MFGSHSFKSTTYKLVRTYVVTTQDSYVVRVTMFRERHIFLNATTLYVEGTKSISCATSYMRKQPA